MALSFIPAKVSVEDACAQLRRAYTWHAYQRETLAALGQVAGGSLDGHVRATESLHAALCVLDPMGAEQVNLDLAVLERRISVDVAKADALGGRQ